jgi:hypothetical protein
MLFGSLPGNQLFLAPCDCRARQTSKANKKEIVLFIQFELIFFFFHPRCVASSPSVLRYDIVEEMLSRKLI